MKKEITRKTLKHRMIMSNSDATYLDCGYAGWVIDGNNWCSPYKGWQVRILIKLCRYKIDQIIY